MARRRPAFYPVLFSLVSLLFLGILGTVYVLVRHTTIRTVEGP